MGKYFCKNGSKIQGDFDENGCQGLGQIFKHDGTLKYKGYLQNSIPNGQGYEFWDNKMLKYKGYFKNGKYDDFQRVYDNNGIIICEGDFSNNQLVGQRKIYSKSGRLLLRLENRNDIIDFSILKKTNLEKAQSFLYEKHSTDSDRILYDTPSSI